MNSPSLELVVQQGFGVVVLLLLPLVAAGVVATAAVGMLAARVGIQDSTVTLVARALAIVLAIGITLESLTAETVGFTVGVWDRLGEVGGSRPP